MTKTGQTRPKWPYIRVTKEWLDAVDAELKRRGETRLWLAQQIGTTKGSISQLLNGRNATSRLVIPIVGVLDMPMPDVQDGREHRFIQAERELRELAPGRFDVVEEFLFRHLRDVKGDKG